MKNVCKNIFTAILKMSGITVFLEDVSVTLIDKTDGSDPTKRETFWMHMLKTLAPYGLNVKNGI